MYAADMKWWDYYIDDVRKVFHGELWTQWHNEETQKFAEKNGLNSWQGRSGSGLCERMLRWGENSGHQAMCLAYLKGAGRIFLLGYDMKKAGDKSHFFGEHPLGFAKANYTLLVDLFNKMATDCAARGVEVINLTRDTALHQFKKSTMEAYLAGHHHWDRAKSDARSNKADQ